MSEGSLGVKNLQVWTDRKLNSKIMKLTKLEVEKFPSRTSKTLNVDPRNIPQYVWHDDHLMHWMNRSSIEWSLKKKIENIISKVQVRKNPSPNIKVVIVVHYWVNRSSIEWSLKKKIEHDFKSWSQKKSKSKNQSLKKSKKCPPETKIIESAISW